MRSPRNVIVVAALAAAALAGCGDRRLVVKVDVLSYLDPALTQVAFGPVPPVPGGLYTGEQDILRDVAVNLMDGPQSVTEVEDVSILMTAIAIDSTGSAQDTLRLYISEEGVDPLTTTPALLLPLDLRPGVTDTVSVELSGDDRVAELFASQRMRLTLTTALRGPDSGDPLNARVRVSTIDAVVIARKRVL